MFGSNNKKLEYLLFQFREIIRETGKVNLLFLGKLIQESGIFSQDEVRLFDSNYILPNSLKEFMLDGASCGSVSDEGSVILEHDQIQLDVPNRLNESVLVEKFIRQNLKSPEITLHQLEDVTCFLANHVKSVVVKDQIVTNLSDDEGRFYRSIWKDFEPIQLQGKTLNLVVEGSSVYTHWLNDTLPVLLLLKESGLSLDAYDHFLFATTQSGFHRQTLQKLGIPDEKIVTRQFNGPLFKLEKMDYVSPIRRSFGCSKKIYELIAEFFNDGFRSDPKKIFVTRRDASRRKIYNESVLEEYLNSFGYESICLGELSIEQAASVFRNASHIVAPHGAGLGNLAFCKRGTRVLELYSAHISKEYWIISNVLGLDYSCFQVPFSPNVYLTNQNMHQFPAFERNGMDLHVDMGAFETKFLKWTSDV